MKIYFRTNYNNKTGIGHLSRVFNLYLELKKIYDCKIVIDKKYSRIPFLNNSKDLVYLYKSNCFKSEKNDAEIFIKKNLINNKNIIIVDDYRLGAIWEKKVSSYSEKVVAIDDYIYRKHCVDILINTKPDLSNIKSDKLYKIKKLNKDSTKYLFGSKYSITNSFFDKKKNLESKKKLNITFYNGGSGNILIYEKIIRLINSKNKKIIINLICGPISKNANSVISKFKKNKNINIIKNNKNFYKTLLSTHLLIGSCGLISFETAKINLPSILIIMNQNQMIDLNSLEEIGHYFILEKNEIKNHEKLSNLILLCLNNRKKIKLNMKKNNILLNYNGKKLIIKSILK